MQITALIQVLSYLKDISANPQLLDSYRHLSDVVRDASKNSAKDLSQEIIKSKDNLRRMLLEQDPGSWGYASYSLFEKLDSNNLFGKSAAVHLDALMSGDSPDYKMIHAELNKKIKLLSGMPDTLSRFHQLFDQVVPSELIQSLVSGERKSALYLYFEGNLAVRNIADLERYSRLWDGILSVFSQLTGEENLMLDIDNFSNKSTVLGVSLTDLTIKAIRKGVEGIVSSLPLILRIRKIQLDVAGLPLNHNMNDLLEEEIQTLISNTSLETAKMLATSCYANEFTPDDLTEDLSKVLKQILSFIERGGKLEFSYSGTDKEVEITNRKMTDSFVIARELEAITADLTLALAKKSHPVYDKEAVIFS